MPSPTYLCYLTVLAALTVTCGVVSAQLNLQANHFALDKGAINPAYTGAYHQSRVWGHDRLPAGGNRPSSSFRGLHVSLRAADGNTGVGMGVQQLAIGDFRRISIQGTYGVQLQMSEGLRVGIGLNARISQYDLSIDDTGVQPPFTLMRGNAGFGVLVYSRNASFGVSVPRLLNEVILDPIRPERQRFAGEPGEATLFAMGSYRVLFRDVFDVALHGQVGWVQGAVRAVKASVLVFPQGVFGMGTAFRYSQLPFSLTERAVDLSIHLRVRDDLSFGLSQDLPIGADRTAVSQRMELFGQWLFGAKGDGSWGLSMF